MAFFGASADPFCAPLFTAMERMSAANGWRLISYDCRGNATNQKGQMEDFVRTETADIAVVYSVLPQDGLNTQVEALYKVCPVVTVGQGVESYWNRYIACHIGVEEGDRVLAAAGYLEENLKADQGVILLYDAENAETARIWDEALGETKVTVLAKGQTWRQALYAGMFLEQQLDGLPNTAGILCGGLGGVEGSDSTLRDRGQRSKIKVVCVSYTPAMKEAVLQEKMDAVVVTAPNDAISLLEDALPKVLAGERLGAQKLPLHVLTPETIDTVELGYKE